MPVCSNETEQTGLAQTVRASCEDAVSTSSTMGKSNDLSSRRCPGSRIIALMLCASIRRLTALPRVGLLGLGLIPLALAFSLGLLFALFLSNFAVKCSRCLRGFGLFVLAQDFFERFCWLRSSLKSELRKVARQAVGKLLTLFYDWQQCSFAMVD